MGTNYSTEMAHANNPEEIIGATQKALITCMKGSIADLRKIDEKRPGMTWDEIEYFLDVWKEKRPTVVTQEQEF